MLRQPNIIHNMMHYTIKLKYLDTNFEIMSTSGQIQEQREVSMDCFIGVLPLIKWDKYNL